jgi:hypothetical protein
MPIETLPNDDHSRLSRIGATGEDMPMTLKEACRVVFKDAISPATLKAEGSRGNLVIHKIGRAHFVTWRELRAMWENCQVATFRPTKAARTKASAYNPATASARLNAQRVRDNLRQARNKMPS